jgi:glucokinase
MILAGDVGGTKTVVAVFDCAGGALRRVREEVFRSREHPSLEAMLETFLAGAPPTRFTAACFGVAGAVMDGKAQITNLPWTLEESALASAAGASRVKLLNELEAAAYGMLFLAPESLAILHPGTRPRLRGNVALIAAGTGLGEALLYFDGERHHPIPSEGGHADFAPRSDEEIELLRYLRTRLGGHVSWERLLSGPGFFNIYSFLRERSGRPEPTWLCERLASRDRSAVIAEAGLAGEDPVCGDTLRLFASLYGAEAGNLVLRGMATGGCFVGGGIAPKLLPALQEGGFLRAFLDKGRFAPLLASIQVAVALEARAPVLGAAHYALRLAGAV